MSAPGQMTATQIQSASTPMAVTDVSAIKVTEHYTV